MNPHFVGGIMIGALLTAGLLTIAIQFWRRPRRRSNEWLSENHQPQPVATTRLLVKERTFEF